MLRYLSDATPSEPIRFREPISPIVFPTEEEMPEGELHFELRTLLYQQFVDHLGPETTVGSDQFMYFDAADPKRCVAPDVYVRLAAKAAPILSWKTWERGAPEIAVEIVSNSDRSLSVWNDKLQRYRHLGVSELVRFDPEPDSELKLRIWNRVEGALVERLVSESRAPSLVFEMYWLVAPADGHPVALRIAAGRHGEQLLLTRLEAHAAEAEARAAEAAARAAEAKARAAEAEARAAETEARKAAEARVREAEARVRELEAELARR